MKYSGKHGDDEVSAPYIWHISYPYQLGNKQYASAFPAYLPVSPTHNYSSAVNQTFMQMVYMRSTRLSDGSWLNPQASQCVMYFCVKTYSASMKGGSFQEEVKSTWPPFDLALPNTSGFNYLVGDRPVRPSQVTVKNYTLTPPDHDTTYTVDRFTGTLLGYWLSGMIHELAYFSDPGQTMFGAQDMGQFFYEAQNADTVGNATDAGPAPVLERIAEIMTTHIRDQANHELVPGTAFSVRTFVHARWYFSALPVGLVSLTGVFLTWTVFLNIRNGIPIWKSSSLAVMVHGLSDDVSSQITAKKLDTMESRADDYTMIMGVKKKGWRLKGALR
jgi:hypothetical protein